MLQNIMESYLNSKSINIYPVNDKSSLPVEPRKNEWTTDHKKLKKVFNFKIRKQKEAFILEIVKYIRDADAEVEFRVKNQKVAVILHALSSELSEIEFEAKVDIDKIRKDVVYFFAKKD